MAKRAGLPLRPTLVSVVILLILSGTGAVGLLAWLSWTESNRLDVERPLERIARRTTQRTMRYLEPAVPYVRLTQRLARERSIDVEEPLSLLDYLEAAMASNPEFTWASHASTDGTYVAVQRRPEGTLVGHVRTIDDEGTRLLEYVREGGHWTRLHEARGDYNPRTRPWYDVGTHAERGTWVEPFLFATVGAPGFMYVAPDRRGGGVRGVWAVEYEMSELSEFLSTLRVGKHGRVYVVTHTGLVVGHPDGDTTAERDGETVIADAASHPNPMLAGAWDEFARGNVTETSFEAGDDLVMVREFPSGSGIPWYVFVVVPAEDFFGNVRQQALHGVLIALLAALLAVLAGAFFSSRVSGALREISDELARVGRFELGTRRLPASSFVREVNEMSDAVESMKSSLRSFGRYVPRDLVRELLRTGTEAELGGQQAELTTLFSDIAGFTTVAESMEPDELVALLGDYLEAMSSAIRDHGGTVDKFIGDAIMAFWGAPTSQEDHAARACRGAIAMRRTLEKLQGEWEAQGRPRFVTRIGINTGKSLVGNIGARERMNYTAMGDPVNLASRLEGLNKAYGTRVLCGERTVQAAGEAFVFRPVDWVAVKGKARAVLVHELVGAAEDVSEEKLAAVAKYRAALDSYRRRDFQEAARAFAEAREAFGGADGPSTVMAERASRYAGSPPPADWDGSHHMTEK